MSGKEVYEALVIEVFCGTGRVTACLRQFGLSSSFGLDHVRPRKCVAPVSLVDLTTKRGRDMLASWLKNPRVVGEFLAPLCGTGSRARSIRLKRKRNAPEPLRDDDNLNGLRNLSFVNKMKISQANKLYHLTAQIVRYAVKHNMIVCVENTQFSLFRATTFWVSVAKLLRYTIFHSCQYGSNRQKKTMLAHNHIAFNQLSKLCPGEPKKHRHPPWGTRPAGHFATREETAYPIQLARDVAECFVQAAEAGMKLPPSQLQDMTSSSEAVLQAVRAQSGIQPKQSKLPPLVPEFATIIAVEVSSDTPRL